MISFPPFLPDTRDYSGRKGDWFQTFTGRRFYLLDPKPEDIDIFDIAHALSNVCRFGGHVKEFYSVAQHSVHVAWELMRWMADPDVVLWGLLHDAAEAYVGDMVRPLKKSPEMAAFSVAEDAIMAAVCDRFGLSREMPEGVIAADEILLMTEKRDLFIAGRNDWSDYYKSITPLEETVEPWDSARAEMMFLSSFSLYSQHKIPVVAAV